ncbi:hypothetical protein EQG49_07785 [Periweissella cryptocerci]|uniref:SpaA-like prealbumin fold domain-containing protein n=1 Tax=Periweissella cryptocerci TaxID=2506420 RepID=A0A4P6YUA7_9LACO|nr:SpaA isopeptide-forming pilin-related protein [Periweissella cryptocerci]QBO36369.1 hypothetical protein EQG49_07785 [Periweissella cryptocerci]
MLKRHSKKFASILFLVLGLVTMFTTTNPVTAEKREQMNISTIRNTTGETNPINFVMFDLENAHVKNALTEAPFDVENYDLASMSYGDASKLYLTLKNLADADDSGLSLADVGIISEDKVTKSDNSSSSLFTNVATFTDDNQEHPHQYILYELNRAGAQSYAEPKLIDYDNLDRESELEEGDDVDFVTVTPKTNYPLGSYHFIKTDGTNPLPGATFAIFNYNDSFDPAHFDFSTLFNSESNEFDSTKLPTGVTAVTHEVEGQKKPAPLTSTSNDEGLVFFGDIDWASYTKPNFFVIETNAPNKYHLNTTPLIFSFSESASNGSTVITGDNPAEVANEPLDEILGRANFTKVRNADFSNPLAALEGATFDLYSYSVPTGIDFSAPVTDNPTFDGKGQRVVDEGGTPVSQISNPDGSFSFDFNYGIPDKVGEDVGPKYYYLVERTAPNKYVQLTLAVPFTLTPENNYTLNSGTPQQIANTPEEVEGEAYFVKQSTNGTHLAGAQFELYSYDPDEWKASDADKMALITAENPIPTVDVDGALVPAPGVTKVGDAVTSGENGTFSFKNLGLGHEFDADGNHRYYYWVEVKKPELGVGFVDPVVTTANFFELNTAYRAYPATTPVASEANPQPVINVPLRNYEGAAYFRKVITDTAVQLPGAKFQLFSIDDDYDVVANSDNLDWAKTDEHGIKPVQLGEEGNKSDAIVTSDEYGNFSFVGIPLGLADEATDIPQRFFVVELNKPAVPLDQQTTIDGFADRAAIPFTLTQASPVFPTSIPEIIGNDPIETKFGEIDFTKYSISKGVRDEEGLAGATFKVYKTNKEQTISSKKSVGTVGLSDVNGKVHIEGIPTGSSMETSTKYYYVEEVTAPDTHIKSTEKHYFSITNTNGVLTYGGSDFETNATLEATDLDFDNEEIIQEYGNAHFKKVIAGTDTGLGGATFDLYRTEEANTTTNSDPIMTGLTSSTVAGKLGELFINEIPLWMTDQAKDAAHFYLVETGKPTLNGKQDVADFETNNDPIYFTLDTDNDFSFSSAEEPAKIDNTPIGHAYFAKVDAGDEKAPLPGAMFELRKAAPDQTEPNVNDPVIASTVSSEEVGHEGEISFPTIPLDDNNTGNFYVIETDAPTGYETPTTDDSKFYRFFTLNEENNFTVNDINNPFENTQTRETAHIEFKKVIEGTTEGLPGATFELRKAAAGQTVPDANDELVEVLNEGGESVNPVTSSAAIGSEGKISFDFDLGTVNANANASYNYYVIETGRSTSTDTVFEKPDATNSKFYRFFTLNKENNFSYVPTAFSDIYNIENQPLSGSAHFKKVLASNHDVALAGAEFKLFSYDPTEFNPEEASYAELIDNGSSIGTAVSTEDGSFNFANLTLNMATDNNVNNVTHFYVVETALPDIPDSESTKKPATVGFLPLEETRPTLFTLNADKLSNFKENGDLFTTTDPQLIENTAVDEIRGNAYFKKVATEGKFKNGLPGAEFKLHEISKTDFDDKNTDANDLAGTNAITKTSSNVAGHIGELWFENLDLGTTHDADNTHYYYLEESSAPTDYSLNSRSGIFFKLGDGENTLHLNENSAVSPLEIKNAPALLNGSAYFMKHDDKGRALQGATFEVRNANDNTVVAQATSDADGNISFDSAHENALPLGLVDAEDNNRRDFYLIETATPDDKYVVDNTKHQFSLSSAQLTYELTAPIINAPIKMWGSANFTKVDSNQPDNTLAGATFELWETSVAGKQQPVGTEPIATVTTKADGKVTFNKNIPLGTKVDESNEHHFYLIETNAPAGYKLETAPLYFSLGALENDAVNTTYPASGTEKIDNDPIGNAYFKKVEANTGNALPGATFELYRDNDNDGKASAGDGDPIATRVSTATGEMSFTNIDIPKNSINNYYLVETAAPFGFEKLEAPYFFKLNADYTFATVAKPTEITNTRIPVPTDPITKKEASGNPSYDFTGLETTKSWILNVNLPQTLSKMDSMNIADNYAKNWKFIVGSTQIIATMKDGSVRTLVPGVDYTETATPAANKVTWNFWKDGKPVAADAQIADVQSLQVTYSTQVTPPANGPWHGLVSSYIEDPSKNTATLTYQPTNGPEVSYDDKAEVWTGGQHFMKQDPEKNLLNNAQFVVYRVVNGKNEYLKYVKVGNDARGKVTWVAKQSQATKIKSGEGWPDDHAKTSKKGKFSVTGLADGDYWIKETKAPSLGSGISFDLLKEPAKFTITKDSWNGSTITITNVLTIWDPSTGGDDPKPKPHKPTPKPKKPIVVVPLPGNNTFPVTGGMVVTSMFILAGIWIITIALRIVKTKKVEDN